MARTERTWRCSACSSANSGRRSSPIRTARERSSRSRASGTAGAFGPPPSPDHRCARDRLEVVDAMLRAAPRWYGTTTTSTWGTSAKAPAILRLVRSCSRRCRRFGKCRRGRTSVTSVASSWTENVASEARSMFRSLHSSTSRGIPARYPNAIHWSINCWRGRGRSPRAPLALERLDARGRTERP